MEIFENFFATEYRKVIKLNFQYFRQIWNKKVSKKFLKIEKPIEIQKN